MKSPNSPLQAWLWAHHQPSLKAAQDLAVIRATAAQSWVSSVLPREALAKPGLLELLIDSGLDLAPGRFDPPARDIDQIRFLAFREDAPIATHELFDRLTIPKLQASQLAPAMAMALGGPNINSLHELHRSHPEFVKSVFAQHPPLAVMQIICGWAKSPQKRKTCQAMRLANLWGADWGPQRSWLLHTHPERVPALDDLLCQFQAETRVAARVKGAGCPQALAR